MAAPQTAIDTMHRNPTLDGVAAPRIHTIRSGYRQAEYTRKGAKAMAPASEAATSRESACSVLPPDHSRDPTSASAANSKKRKHEAMRRHGRRVDGLSSTAPAANRANPVAAVKAT